MNDESKIIRLSDYTQVAQVLEELKMLLEEDRLINFFVAYEYRKEEYGFDPAIVTFFNGDDKGVILLGFLSRLEYHINQWMDSL